MKHETRVAAEIIYEIALKHGNPIDKQLVFRETAQAIQRLSPHLPLDTKIDITRRVVLFFFPAAEGLTFESTMKFHSDVFREVLTHGG